MQGEILHFESPKTASGNIYFHVSESILQEELRGSKATERGEGLGGGCPARAGKILHFEARKCDFPPNSKGQDDNIEL